MNKKILLVICLGIFTTVLGQGLVVPLLPVYANSMGASGFAIGLIYGMFSISRSFLLPFFGKVSDRKGRKPFIVWGLFFYFLASIAFLGSHSVVALIVIRFFQGIASAMIIPVAQAYGAEITPPGTEGRVMGLLNISLYIGLSAGPVFGGTIKDLFGIHSAFVSMSVVCLIGLGASVLFLPSVKEEKIRVKKAQPRSFGQLIRHKNIVGVLFIRYGHMLCVGTLWSFLPLVADTHYGMSSSAIGILVSLIVLTSAVLSYPIGAFADRMSKRFLVFLGGGLAIVAILLLSNASSEHDLFLVVGLFGIGGGFVATTTTAMSAVIGKKLNSAGSVMALLMTGHSAGMFSGPLISGLIMDYSGNIKRSFEIGGGIYFTLLIVAWFLTRDYRQIEKEAIG